MPSEPTANSALSPQSSVRVLTPSSPGESPLDFINKNLRKDKPVTPIMQAVTQPETPKVETPIIPEPKKDEVSFIPPVITVEPTKTETPEPTLSTDPDFESEAEIPPEAQNFKKLRTKYKETSKTLKERETEAEGLRLKIQKYEVGEESPQYVKEMKQRLSELEPLEQVHKIKSSDAYRTTVIEPLAEKKNSLQTLAKDYEISPEVMEQASEITNTRDLNQFLLSHFDEVGALEAKQHINEIQKIKAKANQLESAPKEVSAKLEEEHRSILAVKDAQRKNSIASTAKNAWGNSIRKIVSEGKIQALIPRENDPEFNEKYPHAIQQRAAENYGAIVRGLADAGLNTLSPELSEALATSTILSITSAVAEARADAAEAHISELERTMERSNRYSRPNLGASGGGGSPAPTAKGPISTVEASRNIMANILSKKA